LDVDGLGFEAEEFDWSHSSVEQRGHEYGWPGDMAKTNCAARSYDTGRVPDR